MEVNIPEAYRVGELERRRKPDRSLDGNGYSSRRTGWWKRTGNGKDAFTQMMTIYSCRYRL